MYLLNIAVSVPLLQIPQTQESTLNFRIIKVDSLFPLYVICFSVHDTAVGITPTNEMYKYLNDAYAYEVQYYKTLDNKNLQEAKKYCNNYNYLINNRKNELISIYDKFNIKHN